MAPVSIQALLHGGNLGVTLHQAELRVGIIWNMEPQGFTLPIHPLGIGASVSVQWWTIRDRRSCTSPSDGLIYISSSITGQWSDPLTSLRMSVDPILFFTSFMTKTRIRRPFNSTLNRNLSGHLYNRFDINIFAVLNGRSCVNIHSGTKVIGHAYWKELNVENK